MSQLRGSANYIWNITDVLGHGATGTVYKGRHKKTGELFAIKTFNQMSQMRPADVQMREFEVLKKLHHENLVCLLDVETESHTQMEILVMELCTGGSLFNLLDDPVNAFGVEETEFLCILNDVACGMRQLHDQGIVHRDIKPGNIMRYISEDGRSIYKLIDFGAARELQGEEQFMSLYGTEEYLYPDLYERAVLRRHSVKQFNAVVDLWSIGVTMYHIATGQLPFRPFGGRKNKDTMYKITTTKANGVLSGVQHIDGGPIEWSRQLPPSSRLSEGLKRLLTPLLAGLLECDQERMMKFDEFFQSVKSIVRKNVIHVFSVKTCNSLSIYIDPDEQLTQFQELIAEQTDVRSQDQQLLFENHDLDRTVKPLETVAHYPHTSAQNPIYLYCKATQLVPVDSQPLLHILPMPTLSADVQLDGDYLAAKNCCAVAYYSRNAMIDLIQRQRLIYKAAQMHLLVLSREIEHVRDVVTQFAYLVHEITKRIDIFLHNQQILRSASEVKLLNNGSVDESADETNETATQSMSLAELQTSFNQIHDRVLVMKTEIDGQHNLLTCPGENKMVAGIQSWLQTDGCGDEHRCVMKADILVNAFKSTLSDFQRDRTMKKLSFNEEQIHKFEKHKTKINSAKVLSLIHDHCYPNTKKIYQQFFNWFMNVWQVQCRVSDMQCEVARLVEKQRHLTAALDNHAQSRMPGVKYDTPIQVSAVSPNPQSGDNTGSPKPVVSSPDKQSPHTAVQLNNNNNGPTRTSGNNMRLTASDLQLLNQLQSSLEKNTDEMNRIKKMADESLNLAKILAQ